MLLEQKQLEITEVWAQLFLSVHDCDRINDFMLTTMSVKPRYLVRKMHITIYHARRPMSGVIATTEEASVLVPAKDLRFMVMAPGGENPRPELDPEKRKIGVRLHKQSIATPVIRAYRGRLLCRETPAVLGRRKPSTNSINAFGARHFQPHMAVLRAGSGVDRNLKIIGEQFREALGDLTFDRFEVDVVRKTVSKRAV